MNAIIASMSNYEPILPFTPPTTSQPFCRRQGPLHNTWQSHHCRYRPLLPSSSATPTIVAITGLVVACCLVPPAATVILTIVIHCRRNPTNDSVPAAASFCPLPPLRSSPPTLLSCSLRPLDCSWCRHGLACGVDALPVQCGKCCSCPCPPCWGTGPLR
jgi:hypothetical protein